MNLIFIIYCLLWSLSPGSITKDYLSLSNMAHSMASLCGTVAEATNNPLITEDWNLLGQSACIRGFRLHERTFGLVKDDSYAILSMIPIDAQYDCCLVLSPNDTDIHDVLLFCYDAQQDLIDVQTVESKVAYFHPAEDTAFLSIVLPQKLSDAALLIQDGKDDCYVVSCEKNTSLSSINSALQRITREGVVIVLPGTYKENVKAWNKKIHLIGTDRKQCILENYTGSYYAPPLEIAAGTVTNMTIRSNGGYDDTKPGAYGIHVENDSLCNEELTIRNCDISSRSNSAVGIGLRGGCQVLLDQCTLTGREYGLFCHDSAYVRSTGVQNISVTNCRIEGLTGRYALRFDSQGVPGATVNVLFQNNTLVNDNVKKNASLLSTINQGGKGGTEHWQGLKNYYLLPESCRNSDPALNP